MKTTRKPLLLMLAALLLSTAAFAQSCPTLVWSDEFDGTSLNLSNWEVQTGDGCAEGICGWGNSELQSYQADNLTVAGGVLTIEAKKERIRGSQYTSGRIRSKGLADFSYGHMEARIKLPGGQGFWPAFWMLSTNEPYGGWPQSGEIDIMEYLGQHPEEVFGTIHYGELYPGNQFQGNPFFLKDGTNFVDDYHVFAIDWEPGEIRWYVDGELYSTKTSSDVAPFNWPFDGGNQMHFLLNLAVGGNLPGSPDNSTPFPSQMMVDYVRVYDTSTGYLTGDNLVKYQEQGVTYTVEAAPGNASYTWTVPAGATIASGANSNSITVNWGDETSTGKISVDVSSGCGNSSYDMYVQVEPSFSRAFALENFDGESNATLTFTNGTLTTVANPDNGGVNTSANSGEYARDAGSQYDVIAYATTALGDADDFSNNLKKIYIDLYTDAPIGTTVLVQLESGAATPDNYPVGRHSRYQTQTTVRNGWERIEMPYLDRPDGSVVGTDVSNLLILFAPNSSDASTYTFDNLDVWAPGSTPPPSNNAPSVSVTSPNNGASFDDGTVVSLSANASDSDGSVSSVEFFVNGSSVGTDNNAPYSVNWTIGVGSYSITAVATDNEGASTTSSAVSVTGNSVGGGDPLPMTTAIAMSTSSKGPNLTGNADITVTNGGSPVANATVSVTWSGDFSGSQTGTTNGSGVVSFSTGGVRNANSFTITIDDVTATGYVWDQAGSQTSANTGSARGVVAQAFTQSLAIYPNPATDHVHISVAEHVTIDRVVIVDMMGRQQLVQDVNGAQVALDIQNLQSGMYMVIIESAGFQHMSKISKN